jgi:hypothetical protein
MADKDDGGYKVDAHAPASPALQGTKGRSNSKDNNASDNNLFEDVGEEANGQDAPLLYGMEELQ